MNCSSIADGSDASFLGNKKGENFSSRPLKKIRNFINYVHWRQAKFQQGKIELRNTASSEF